MTSYLDFEIDGDKIEKYLLNPNHKDGWSKAKLLLANGFSHTNPGAVASALFQHARVLWPGRVKSTSYGEKHILDGLMVMPNGTAHNMRVVWQIDAGSTVVRLITAY